MAIKKTVQIETITTKKWELSSDDVEEIILKHFQLKAGEDGIDIDWNVGDGYIRGLTVTSKVKLSN